MNRIVCHHFSVRRFALPMFVAFWAVGALAIPAVAQQDDEAKVQECLTALREYATHLNGGDVAAAYKMLAAPVHDMMTESDFRDFVTNRVTEGKALEEEAKTLVAELGTGQTEMILAIERPEVHGRHAIAGMIVAADLRFPGIRGAADVQDDIKNFKDPDWVREMGMPTWGSALRMLGSSPEACDLVSGLEDVIGDPETTYWPIARKWLIATFADDGRWKVWPPASDARYLDLTINLTTMHVGYNLVKSGGSRESFGPWILPKPSLEALTYARWIAVERDPAKCPKCGRYVQQNWEYCPFDGTKLERHLPPSVKREHPAGQEPEEDTGS